MNLLEPLQTRLAFLFLERELEHRKHFEAGANVATLLPLEQGWGENGVTQRMRSPETHRGNTGPWEGCLSPWITLHVKPACPWAFQVVKASTFYFCLCQFGLHSLSLATKKFLADPGRTWADPEQAVSPRDRHKRADPAGTVLLCARSVLSGRCWWAQPPSPISVFLCLEHKDCWEQTCLLLGSKFLSAPGTAVFSYAHFHPAEKVESYNSGAPAFTQTPASK